MHSPQDRIAVEVYDKMKALLLPWFIVWSAAIQPLPLSFAHFPSFNLICSGQVAAYKQSMHGRLMMQRHTAPAYCVHIFANSLL